MTKTHSEHCWKDGADRPAGPRAAPDLGSIKTVVLKRVLPAWETASVIRDIPKGQDRKDN